MSARKQTIRWGRADAFNPTDNLIPYDYLDTFADVRLSVPGQGRHVPRRRPVRVRLGARLHTTRLPLEGQRWYPQLPGTAVFDPTGEVVVELPAVYRDTAGNSRRQRPATASGCALESARPGRRILSLVFRRIR